MRYDRSAGGSSWASNPIQKPFGSSGAPKPWNKEPWRPDSGNERYVKQYIFVCLYGILYAVSDLDPYGNIGKIKTLLFLY